MAKIPLIFTSINFPTEAIQKFSIVKGYSLYVSGDNKSPANWSYKNSHYLSVDDQKKQFPKLHNLVSENHYARKNFGYLAAIKSTNPKKIFESDDDNIPNNFFPNDSQSSFEELDNVTVEDESKVININSFFTESKVWPRGFPLSSVNANPKYKIEKRSTKILIEHSLTDLDPDVDAIYRLTNGEEVNFIQNKKIALGRDIYCPFNSQSTFWSKEVFSLLYLPSMVTSRVCDIWRGYISQRIVWELGGNIIFLSPCVYQMRNRHNLMRDFGEELDLYLKVDKLIDVLDSAVLKGSTNNMLYTVYERLVENGILPARELKILEAWLKYF